MKGDDMAFVRFTKVRRRGRGDFARIGNQRIALSSGVCADIPHVKPYVEIYYSDDGYIGLKLTDTDDGFALKAGRPTGTTLIVNCVAFLRHYNIDDGRYPACYDKNTGMILIDLNVAAVKD